VQAPTISQVQRSAAVGQRILGVVQPRLQQLDGVIFAEWVQTQRLSSATPACYRENIRLHIDPHLGAQPIARLTCSAVDARMRKLEASGRADGQGGLSAPALGRCRPGPRPVPPPADAQDPDLGRGWRLLTAIGMRCDEALAPPCCCPTACR
jgi:hypothetical protein